MSLTSALPFVAVEPGARLASDEAVRRQVWTLLTGLYPPTRVIERRSEQRFAFPHLIYLTPTNCGLLPCGESVIVIGKHLAERGLGFFHQRPLPYRYMIASLESHTGTWLGFLVDISWCRFTQHGWYISGGRLLEAVPSPLELIG